MTLSDFFLNVSYQIQRILSIPWVLTVYLLGMLISFDELFKWYFFSFFVCWYGSVQFSSVAQSCTTLCNPMNHTTPGFPAHHQLPESTQTHANRVGDAIQPPNPLSSPSPPASKPSQHQSLFQWVNSLHEVAKLLEFQLQHQSFQWTPRTDLL